MPSSSADTPDLLEVALDKNDFKSGDTMNVSVTARTAGRLTLNVFTDRLVVSTSQDVKVGAVHVPLAVGKDWGTGAYLVATLRRPLDAPAQRMPGRAIGVQWFSIDRSERTLALDMKLPSTMRPNNALNVPIKLAGLAAGEEAQVVVAAVDVGILNLTNYKPPAPDKYYLGQRQLTAEIRDLYGQLIDGMQGVRGTIRSGGDSGAELAGPPPTQAPLALYSGIVRVAPDGTAQVKFRHSRLHWHRARDDGGLEQKQGRQSLRRRHRTRSRRADCDTAAFSAHRRPRQCAIRTRQRRRRGRRL